jgi:hypothetical protein
MSKSKKVSYLQTHNGRYATRDEVRYIKGVYYHYDDLVKIKGKWNRKDNGLIFYDWEEKTWHSGVSEDDRMYQLFGTLYRDNKSFKYTANCLNNTFKVPSEEYAIFLGARYVAGYRLYSYRKVNPSYEFNLPYSYDPTLEYQKSIIKNALPIDRKLADPLKKTLDRVFKEFAIGLEIETSSGFLNEKACLKSRMIPVKDGSINGTEYISPPIANSKDYSRLYEFVKNNLTIDEKCSMHVHVSGLPKTPKAGLAFYYLCYRLQGELHACIPAYKRSINFLKKKDKDHSRLLPSFGMEYAEKVNVDDHFQNLYDFLTGVPNLRFGGPHPNEGNNKWNYHMRYYYMNMLNLYFSKSGTVEFRLFPPTLDMNLINIWVLLCLAIVKVAKTHADLVLANNQKLNLQEVIGLSHFDNHIKDILLNYIVNATIINNKRYIRNNDSFSTYLKDFRELSSKIDSSVFTIESVEKHKVDNSDILVPFIEY